jgi:hypothetical protein
MESYNGYSATERLGKLKAMNRLLASGDLAPAAGPCELCGDSDPPSKFEYYDEDYGAPADLGKARAVLPLPPLPSLQAP